MFFSFYQIQLVPPPVGGPAGDFITLAVKLKVISVLLGRLLFTVVALRGSHGKQE